MPRARSWRIAAALWIVFAVVAWNVVLDQVIALAGRQYIIAAVWSAERMGPYVRINDWMRPAVTRGFWLANAAAATILTVGFVGLRLAARSSRR
jgi:hypothetical protein